MKLRNTLLIGALSAVAALLLSPNSGKENRRILKQKAKDKFAKAKNHLAKSRKR